MSIQKANCRESRRLPRYRLIYLLPLAFVLTLFASLPLSGLVQDDMAYPSARFTHSVAYDGESDRVIMFGGIANPIPTLPPETWAYDYNSNSWTNMAPEFSPAPRFGPGFAYDSESDVIILYGGSSTGAGNLFSDTWAYDFNSNTWTEMHPESSPPAYSALSTGMVYDSESDRVILHGGWTGSRSSNATWAYDYNANSWAQINPEAKPAGGRNLTYDSVADRVVLFGGSPATFQRIDETWAYDHNSTTWTLLDPSNEPSRRSAPLVYDVESNRTIVFSGYIASSTSSTQSEELWVFDLGDNLWIRMDDIEGPSGRGDFGMVYDSESDRVILFGGQTTTGPEELLGDTWAYDLNEHQWTDLTPEQP